MTAMAPVPEDHPLMIAWKAYQATEDFKSSLFWVTTDKRMRPERAEEVGLDPMANKVTDEMREQRAKGSLWGAFMAGFESAGGNVRV